MTTQYKKIYLGRNNLFFVAPTYNGVRLTAAEMADITAIEIHIGSVYISSALYPDLFDFTTWAADQKFLVNIQGLALTAGKDEDCEIIIYSATYPTFGRIAGPTLILEVTADASGDGVLADPLSTLALDDLNDVLATGGSTGDVLTQLPDGSFAIEKQPLEWSGVIGTPSATFTALGGIIPVSAKTVAEIILTNLEISCDADPETELDLDLYYADDLITRANPVLICQCDTTAGVASMSAFDTATIPAGKAVYFSFGTIPDAEIKWIAVTFTK